MNNVVQDYIDQKYQYDDYGQLIRQSDGGHVQDFAWDALGRLVRSKNDKAETYYRYDALGRRIEKFKQHIQAGHSHYTETTQYGWDGDTLAYESTNLYTKHYVYENGSFVPLIQATYRQQINQHQTPAWEHGYDYDKDPLWHTEQKANAFDRVWFYHCDHLGTPQEMSDQTGAIVWSANYKAWGECKTENHTKRDIWDSEIITNNLRFQGQYYDQETGLHYNRYRYYSPYVGRFISKDPIGLLGGLNTFAYAPNPVEWVDPLGLVCNSPNGYKTGDVDKHRNLSPGVNRASGHGNNKNDGYVQSHHGIQDAWAKRNIENYRRNEAPGTLLQSASSKPHANISAAQSSRRAQPGGWDTTLKQEFNISYREMLTAGVPENQARKALKDSYKYFDTLRCCNKDNPFYDI